MTVRKWRLVAALGTAPGLLALLATVAAHPQAFSPAPCRLCRPSVESYASTPAISRHALRRQGALAAASGRALPCWGVFAGRRTARAAATGVRAGAGGGEILSPINFWCLVPESSDASSIPADDRAACLALITAAKAKDAGGVADALAQLSRKDIAVEAKSAEADHRVFVLPGKIKCVPRRPRAARSPAVALA